MIAPPSALYQAPVNTMPNMPARKPTKGNLGQKLGLGGTLGINPMAKGLVNFSNLIFSCF